MTTLVCANKNEKNEGIELTNLWIDLDWKRNWNRGAFDGDEGRLREVKNEMEWTRSETLGLAFVHCTTCHGLGLRAGRRGKDAPCNCVLRAIFRACFRRFRQCVEKEKHLSQCTLHFTGGRERSFSWGRKDEEYIADFLLMARRLLEDDEYRIFKMHYLLGADWKLCTIRLKMDRGDFFHFVYKIEARLGKAFREQEPYGLFPLDEYFYGATRDVVATVPERESPLPLRPPMAA